MYLAASLLSVDAPTRSHAVQLASDAYQRARWQSRVLLQGGRVLLGISLIAAWQGLSGRVLDPFFFASPGAILAELNRLAVSGAFTLHVALTVEEALLGYVLGALTGSLAAVAFGLSRRAYAIAEPFVLVVYSVPSIAVAPLLIAWFGIGLLPKVLLSAYFVFFFVFVNGVTGVRSVPRGWIDAARVMGANPIQLAYKIVLRGAAPYLMAGLKAGMPLSVIGAISAEFIASQRGIGYLVSIAAAQYQTAGVFAALLILSGLVVVMHAVLNSGRTVRSVLRWRA